MKKGLKIIIGILIILAILLCGTYYALIPNEKVKIEKGNLITGEELLAGSYIEYFEVLKNPLRLQGEISIKDNEVKDIIYTVMTNNNLSELENVKVQIENNLIKVVSPYKVLGFIDSQIELNLKPSVVDNNLNIKLTNLKMGKLNLSDKIIANTLQNYKNDIPFEIKENNIIIDKSYTYPITLDSVSIESKNIIIDLKLQADNLIDFITKYKIKVIN